MTISQYFVYKRPIAWTLLLATLAGGFAAYPVDAATPGPGDPDPARPGLDGVSRREPDRGRAGSQPEDREEAGGEPGRRARPLDQPPGALHGLRRPLRHDPNAEAVWQDLDNKLAAMTDLPTVANGVPLKPRLDKDFGDTVAMMLTLSSPPVSELEVERRAEVIAEKIRAARAARPESLRGRRYSGVLVHPSTVELGNARAARSGLPGTPRGPRARRRRPDDPAARRHGPRLPARRRPRPRRHAGRDQAVGIGQRGQRPGPPRHLAGGDRRRPLRAPRRAEGPLPGRAGRRRQVQLRGVAPVRRHDPGPAPPIDQGGEDRATRRGRRAASTSTTAIDGSARPAPTCPDLVRRLQERNHNAAGGTVELPRQNLAVKPSGKLRGDGDIGDVVVDLHDGSPLYLRDLFEVVRGYDDPPKFLNFRTLKFDRDHPPTAIHAVSAAPSPPGEGEEPKPHAGATRLWTSRAITLAIRQVKGTQIADFGRELDDGLASLKDVLPDDLRIERTSDEPERVRSKIDLFIDNLIEAIVIVVLISLLFMEWRSAVLIALSIPITLGMTFIFCSPWASTSSRSRSRR